VSASFQIFALSCPGEKSGGNMLGGISRGNVLYNSYRHIRVPSSAVCVDDRYNYLIDIQTMKLSTGRQIPQLISTCVKSF